MLNTNIEDVPNFMRISPTNMKKSYLKNTLREKCPNTEFFLVRIFPHSDRIWRDTPYLDTFHTVTPMDF